MPVGGTFQYRALDPRTREQADLLGEDFTVYQYDRRGRGGSTDIPPYSVEREREDMAALIADAGASAHLSGMSAGTVLALDAAARSGGRPPPCGSSTWTERAVPGEWSGPSVAARVGWRATSA